MSNTEGQIIKVRIAGGSSTINEVFHDNTLKGTGQPGNELGVAESVLQDIASKVSDVQVNGESVVEEGVANITVGYATITIQKNGTDIDSFTVNETTDKAINIEVPTTLRQLSTVAEQRVLDSGITSSGVEQITVNENNIANINEKIPSQASAENKLADKNFVNSSIATNTANFIGTFNSVEELEAYSGTVTNNDYAFVISEDSAGNTVYNRYKYTTATTPASWVFEYELNNSSFTADQWAAINSGATTTNIGQIATNTSTISGHIADKNNPHQVTKAQVGLGNVDNTSDTNKPVSTAQQTALNAKANVALDNLTNVGKNIANWSSNVTNCITEIPQDIKLELNAGVLTLKAGSKVYVPNGPGVFTAITTTADYVVSQTANGKHCVYVNTAQTLWCKSLSGFSSGATAPTGVNDGIWYNTTENRIEWYTGTGWSNDGGRSFPIAIVTVSNGAISSIDQVFNGFGYIGSHVFALPGLKCLIPNGKNADGTLKNLTGAVSVVRVQDVSPVISNYRIIEIFNTGNIGRCQTLETNNDNYNIVDGAAVSYSTGICKVYTDSNGKITSFISEKIFRVLNYNDTEYIAHQAMPSSRYVDLTLPTTGQTVTAPADGYITVLKSAPVNGQYFTMINNTNGANISMFSTENLTNLRLLMPVSKGDVILLNYTATGATGVFRLIYANGSK